MGGQQSSRTARKSERLSPRQGWHWLGQWSRRSLRKLNL